MESGISTERKKAAGQSAAGFIDCDAVDPGIREMPGGSSPYVHCRTYRATMPVTTCLLRRLARLPGANSRDTIGVSLDPGCGKCAQGEAVARWAEDCDIHKTGQEEKNMGRMKVGKCVNCGRDNMTIKARGCCANCYDTPIRKGYKQGSPEWIACQAEIRARLDPLFRPDPGKKQGNDSGEAVGGAESAQSVEGFTDNPVEPLPSSKKNPITWKEVISNVVDAGLAPDLINAIEGADADEKGQGDLPKIAACIKESLKPMAEYETPSERAQEPRSVDRYISLFFDGEEPKDRRLYEWLRTSASVNRRGTSAEVMSLLESMINQEEQRRETAKFFSEYAAESAKMDRLIKERYSIHTPDGRTVPAEGLTLADKFKLSIVIGLVAVGLSVLMFYLYWG